ncbi:MAG: hypothetical protein ACYDA2_06770 [Acidimicrobiales bacterium]
MVLTEGTVAPPGSSAPSPPARHRRGHVVLAVVGAVVLVGAGLFTYRWTSSGPRPLSSLQAVERFRATPAGAAVLPGTLRPASGVYRYTGTATEHVSLPPKSQSEGPSMPATVSYDRNGCWTFRMDFSDSHWQSATYCPRNGDLVQVGRAGWYRWDFVAFAIADTATFICSSPQLVLPALLELRHPVSFSCTGSNDPIKTAAVVMTGTTTYVGSEVLQVAGRAVPTVHVRELDTFSGGQTGTNESDTWFATADALPVKGTWRTEVNTPSPVGTSTMTGSGSFLVGDLRPSS